MVLKKLKNIVIKDPINVIEFIVSVVALGVGLYVAFPPHGTEVVGIALDNAVLVFIFAGWFIGSALTAMVGVWLQLKTMTEMGLINIAISMIFVSLLRLFTIGAGTGTWLLILGLSLVAAVCYLTERFNNGLWTQQ